LRKENVAVAYRVIVKCGGGAFFVPNEAAENLKLCTAGQLRVLLFALSKGFSETSPESVAEELGIIPEDAKDLRIIGSEEGFLNVTVFPHRFPFPKPFPLLRRFPNRNAKFLKHPKQS
jgi:hypothetical protein